VVRHFIIEREKASIEDKKTIAKLSKRVEELEKPFALEFCGGKEVRVPEVIKDAVGWSGFCPCAIPVGSNASPPSMSLWMRSLLISRDKNLTLNG